MNDQSQISVDEFDIISVEGVDKFFEFLKNAYFSHPDKRDLIRQLFNNSDGDQIAFEHILRSLQGISVSQDQTSIDEVKFRLSMKVDVAKLNFSLMELLAVLDLAGFSDNINMKLKLDVYFQEFDAKRLAAILTDFALAPNPHLNEMHGTPGSLIVNGYGQIFPLMQKFELLEKRRAFICEMIWKWDTSTFSDVRDDLPVSLCGQFKYFNQHVDRSITNLLANQLVAQANPYQIALLLNNGVFDHAQEARYLLYSELVTIAKINPTIPDVQSYVELVRNRFSEKNISMPMIDSVTGLDL